MYNGLTLPDIRHGPLDLTHVLQKKKELPDMNAVEMAKEGFYVVESVIRHCYCQGWRLLTLCERFGVE